MAGMGRDCRPVAFIAGSTLAGVVHQRRLQLWILCAAFGALSFCAALAIMANPGGFIFNSCSSMALLHPCSLGVLLFPRADGAGGQPGHQCGAAAAADRLAAGRHHFGVLSAQQL